MLSGLWLGGASAAQNPFVSAYMTFCCSCVVQGLVDILATLLITAGVVFM